MSTPVPVAGDDFERWLKARRDDLLDGWVIPPPAWHTVDAADTGTPLDQPVSEGGDTSPHPF